MRVTLEMHTNIPAFSCEFWAWSLGFMLVKQVLSCHPSIETKIISKVVRTEQKNHEFFNQKIFIHLEIVSFFYECKCVKIFYLFWKKTVVTSHRCLRLTTDKQIVLWGSNSVNCTVSFWVFQSGKIRASFICGHSGTFWNKWICFISAPRQQGFTTLKWQLLWS